jgi:hypothetical protein
LFGRSSGKEVRRRGMLIFLYVYNNTLLLHLALIHPRRMKRTNTHTRKQKRSRWRRSRVYGGGPSWLNLRSKSRQTRSAKKERREKNQQKESAQREEIEAQREEIRTLRQEIKNLKKNLKKKKRDKNVIENTAIHEEAVDEESLVRMEIEEKIQTIKKNKKFMAFLETKVYGMPLWKREKNREHRRMERTLDHQLIELNDYLNDENADTLMNHEYRRMKEKEYRDQDEKLRQALNPRSEEENAVPNKMSYKTALLGTR